MSKPDVPKDFDPRREAFADDIDEVIIIRLTRLQFFSKAWGKKTFPVLQLEHLVKVTSLRPPWTA